MRATVAEWTGTPTADRFRTGGDYHVYAQVTGIGTPTVTANVTSFDAGQTAVTMTAGSYTVGATTYNYRSAVLTANTGLTTGQAYAYTIGATDSGGTTTSPAQSAQAQAAGCTTWTQSVEANADAFTSQESTGQNYNTTVLNVFAEAGEARRTFVAFPLPTRPTNCTVTAATLRLRNAAAQTGATIQAYRNAAAFTETGVTWANQPATSGTPATAATASGIMQWTVTTQTQALYSANTGFQLRDAAEGSGDKRQAFDSRSVTTVGNRPQLTVTFG